MVIFMPLSMMGTLFSIHPMRPLRLLLSSLLCLQHRPQSALEGMGRKNVLLFGIGGDII